MTLADLLPSVRSFAALHHDPLAELVAAHGTPLQVLDEREVGRRCAGYAAAFGADAVAYSAKAGLHPGLAEWIASSGLGCFVGGGGALTTALRAGFPPARITLTGPSISLEDMDAAFACGATIVARSPGDVAALHRRAPAGQRVLLRVTSACGRGGFRLGSGTSLSAIADLGRLDFRGLDLSIGHRLSRFGAYEAHLREAAAFCAVIQARLRRPVPVLNLGGGYSNDFATAAFASRVRGLLALATDRYAIVPPRLTVSPGRALVGPAGTTVYRLLDPDTVDGPDCTCGEPHAARLVGRVSRAPLNPMTVAGVPVLLPADTARGDLIALSGTGAYHHNDAHATVLGLRDGRASVLAERTELFR